MRNSIEDYASQEILEIWSGWYRVTTERELWVLIMDLQVNAGVSIPESAIADYKRVLRDDEIDWDRIFEIEQVTRHDLRARLQAFNEAAGHNYAHWGLTSCDITENATQVQIRQSLRHVYSQARRVVSLLGTHIEATKDTICAARTHNQLAQPTLLGKRFATIADELLDGMGLLELLIQTLPYRGLVGAVGTAEDLVTLLGDNEVYQRLNEAFIYSIGGKTTYASTGQVYPRSNDLSWTRSLLQLAAACNNLAQFVRLESGHGRMWEQFDDGQVGSSAMPHKNNPITAERINGLVQLARGYAQLFDPVAQWYEGDVSDSVTRRVGLPALFYAVDAILENSAVLLQRLDLSKEAYEQEWIGRGDLRSGELMSLALRKGADRDKMYKALQAESFKLRMIHDVYSDCPLTLTEILETWQADPALTEAKAQIGRVLQMIEGVTLDAIGQSSGALRSEES